MIPLQFKAKKDNQFHIPGKYQGIPIEDYHACSEISSSLIKAFCESPYEFETKRAGEWERKRHFDKGQAAHCLLLEPDKFHSTFTNGDNLDCRKKADKEFIAESELNGQIVLRGGDYQDVLNAVETFQWIQSIMIKDKGASPLFAGGEAEVSYFWEDPKTWIPCRCRPDYLRLDDGIIIDYKTTRKGGSAPFDFNEQIRKLLYHIQAIHYMNGINAIEGAGTIKEFIWVAQEIEAPYQVSFHRLSETFIDIDDEEKLSEDYGIAVGDYTRVMLELQNYLNTNPEYTGYPTRLHQFKFPKWYVYNYKEGNL
jgi:exodeoxyribonuclease VIII